ncbi:hypothetical protein M0804_002519 [Polistes exclamans]|nr:hypothetical protein M0804_002519 [Polistes exclamans]
MLISRRDNWLFRQTTSGVATVSTLLYCPWRMVSIIQGVLKVSAGAIIIPSTGVAVSKRVPPVARHKRRLGKGENRCSVCGFEGDSSLASCSLYAVCGPKIIDVSPTSALKYPRNIGEPMPRHLQRDNNVQQGIKDGEA